MQHFREKLVILHTVDRTRMRRIEEGGFIRMLCNCPRSARLLLLKPEPTHPHVTSIWSVSPSVTSRILSRLFVHYSLFTDQICYRHVHSFDSRCSSPSPSESGVTCNLSGVAALLEPSRRHSPPSLPARCLRPLSALLCRPLPCLRPPICAPKSSKPARRL